MRGEVISPRDEHYDPARRVWNGRIDRYPALIVRCVDLTDVLASLEFARREDLAVAVRSGGHSMVGHSVCDGGIVIDLSHMQNIWIDSIRRIAHAQAGLTLGEFVRALQEWASYYGENLDELHIPFNFVLLGARWNARVIRRVVDTIEAAIPAGAWPNYVLGNPDEPRIATRLGQRQARVAILLLLTLRGTPTVYYGDELGMSNVEISPELIQDPQEKNVPGLGLGRDPARTPMQWDASPNAGFCPPHVIPWLLTTSRSM